MKKLISGVLLSSSLLGLAQVTVEKPVELFTTLKLPGVFDVQYRQSDTNAVIITAYNQADVDAIKCELVNGILTIDKNDKLSGKMEPTIIVKGNKLNRIHVSGTGEFESLNKIKANDLTIISQGTGEVELDIDANNIVTELDGTGDIKLSGTAKSLSGLLAGTGDIKAYELTTDSVNLKISGTGDARVNASKTVVASVSGPGNFIYKGNPVNKNIEVSGPGHAKEYNKNKSDTTRFNLGDSEVIILHDEEVKDDDDHKSGKHHDHHKKKLVYDDDSWKHWTGIDIGANGYFNDAYGTNVPTAHNYMDLNYGKSYHFGFNLIERQFKIYKHYAVLVTGLGIDHHAYGLKRNVTFQKNNDFVTAVTDSINKFSRNKLIVNYVTVPLMLEFNTSRKPHKSFHIAVGATFGYRINSRQEQKFNIPDGTAKTKIKHDFNLNPFKISPTVRLGYGDLTVYAQYSLTGLFEEAKGPTLYPFAAGLSINF